jgi:ornithine cyclodeaminase
MGLEDVQPGAVVLHVSLRDLHPSAILGAVNVVDDADHVCRERTSLHLAEQEVGDRSFIHAPIGALVRGGRLVARRPGDVVVFSPFGLGVLDLALAAWVRAAAEGRGLGERVAFLRDGAAAAAH